VILKNGQRVLFCNNEDWRNPKTRIWFVPGSKGRYGCVYVGYDDSWARGGMNTKGVACDWVGGFAEQWQPDPSTCVRGNPTERMLESCATTEEAISFFRSHHEPDFVRSKVLVADANGVSVIIGATDGTLQVEKADGSRCFGYNSAKAGEWLAESDEPTVSNAAGLLQACLQQGQYATKYSNIFDLRSGDIYLYQFHKQVQPAKLNILTELRKGGHYYDMTQIHAQLVQGPIPLLACMKPFFLDDFPLIVDPTPNQTQHIRSVLLGAISGQMCPEDYTPELWKAMSASQKEIRSDIARYGDFVSIALVGRQKDARGHSDHYRIEFQKVILLMHYVLDSHNKIASIQSEGAERKPGADLGE
jgi:hypothetical protein